MKFSSFVQQPLIFVRLPLPRDSPADWAMECMQNRPKNTSTGDWLTLTTPPS